MEIEKKVFLPSHDVEFSTRLDNGDLFKMRYSGYPAAVAKRLFRKAFNILNKPNGQTQKHAGVPQ